MGLFDIFKKKKDAEPEVVVEEPSSREESREGSDAYLNMLSAYIGLARLQQLAFGRQVVDGREWSLDLEKGLITFGEDSYPAGLLGSESQITNTWLWAFANPGGFSEAVLEDGNKFYARCMAQHMDDIKGPEMPLTELVNGHNIASLASASHKEKVCYYRCPYEDGAAYVLVKNLPASVFEPANALDVAKAITDLIGQMPLNHTLLVKGILGQNCETTAEEPGLLSGTFADGATIQIKLDQLGRIESITTPQSA